MNRAFKQLGIFFVIWFAAYGFSHVLFPNTWEGSPYVGWIFLIGFWSGQIELALERRFAPAKKY